MQEYSGEAWEEIHKVEIVADFGYDSLDWEFCIDDLKVQYITIPKTVTEKVSQDQVVLNKDYANGE